MCDWEAFFFPPSVLFQKDKNKKEENAKINAINNETQKEIKEMNKTMNENGEAIETTALNANKQKKNTVSSLRLNTINNNLGLNI